MCIWQRVWVLAVAVAATGVTGCDPGYTYKPINDAENLVEERSTKIGDVRFTVLPDSILIGSNNDFIELTVENKSENEVEVAGAEVRTGGRTMVAKLWPGPDGREERIVPAGTTKKVSLLVELGGAASEVLAPSIAHVWRVRIGNAEHALRFELRRE